MKLERGDILKVSERLQEMAKRNDLSIVDVNTDVDELMNNTGYMLMRLHITGEFLKFRDFLLDLGTIPWLEQIEEINVRAIEGNREYKLRIWMAQKWAIDTRPAFAFSYGAARRRKKVRS